MTKIFTIAREQDTVRPELEAALAAASRILVGKERVVRLAVSCLLAEGHLLIEDVPGVGKTTLAHVLAQLFGLSYQRIQFTSDLLPADVLGVSIYDRKADAFHFHPGPIFAQVVLADEINRATPKAQSALLEAMEERQVTADGETRSLPAPFFVIATQNPDEQIGTFPLPESQLDRFLMRIRIGYPDRDSERELLRGADRRHLLEQQGPVLSPADLATLQKASGSVHVSDPLLDYLQAIIGYSRESGAFQQGLSPRAGLALMRAARAWAFVHGRDMVIPEDLQAVLDAVIAHRLEAREAGATSTAELLVSAVPVP
ncbi:MAG: MoxR family ATPase [Pseudomonadota bacterium]